MEAEEIQKIANTIEHYALEATYGRAVLAAHSLERTIYVLLLTRLPEPTGDDKSVFFQEHEKLKRLTLGRLIERVITEFEISEYWQEELDNMLFFRNRLVHQISLDISSSILRHGNKQRIIEEIEEIKSYFDETNQEMGRMLYEWFESKGIKKEKFREIARQVLVHVENKGERT